MFLGMRIHLLRSWGGSSIFVLDYLLQVGIDNGVDGVGVMRSDNGCCRNGGCDCGCDDDDHDD